MFHRWRRHPLPIEAYFRNALVITYAFPEALLRPLLPPGLELDTFRGCGFVALALVQTEALRPASLPRALGMNFFLAGYRIFTRFRDEHGRALRGLRILRSFADRRAMVWGGNMLTHYNYEFCRAQCDKTPDTFAASIETRSGDGDLDVLAELSAPERPPEGSPFQNWREARRFAGPLPFTFDYEPETHSIVCIAATRSCWNSHPVSVVIRRNTFFEQAPFNHFAATTGQRILHRRCPVPMGTGRRASIKEGMP